VVRISQDFPRWRRPYPPLMTSKPFFTKSMGDVTGALSIFLQSMV